MICIESFKQRYLGTHNEVDKCKETNIDIRNEVDTFKETNIDRKGWYIQRNKHRYA